MTWEAVPVPGLVGLPCRVDVDVVWPEARMEHSLTRISNKSAVLFGGINRSGGTLGDCWLLNIKEAIRQSKPENIWIRCLHHEIDKRTSHAAIEEPSSGRLWIVGGVKRTDWIEEDWRRELADHVKEITFSSNQTLKVLALESVSRSAEKFKEGIEWLPKDLQLAITAKAEKKHIVT